MVRRVFRSVVLRRMAVVGLLGLVRRPADLAREERRREVEHGLVSDAQLSSQYVLLIICSCVIAALGLLQSSAAVIIGAMLISPLMSPIMAMGLTLARFEFAAFNRAAVSLLAGASLAIAAAAAITWASPLKDVTSEILSRSRPTLLDLIVAVFSGIVGAYVTLSRKPDIIAGVAIATALMPPLATVGYGVATRSADIAGGALLLFVTNVVAIVGTVLLVARRYGFRPAHHRHRFWETVIIAVIMTALCAPLSLSLTAIASETRLTGDVRSALETLFRKGMPRISDLRVEVSHGQVRGIQAVVITTTYVPDIGNVLHARYPKASDINVEQVIAADEDTMLNKLRAHETPAAQPSGTETFIRAAATRTAEVTSVRTVASAGGQCIEVILTPHGGTTLGDYHKIERALSTLVPDETIAVVPPRMDLAPVVFDDTATQPTDAQIESFADAAWALRRWGASGVEIISAATPGTQAIARRRAAAVAAALEKGVADGFGVETAITDNQDGDAAQVRIIPIWTPGRQNE